MLIFAVLFLTLFLIYKNIPLPIDQRRGLFLFIHPSEGYLANIAMQVPSGV